MGEGRKALKKAWGLEGLHVERERRKKGEHKLGRENEKFKMLTNEDQASLNSQKEGTKHCLLFY